MSIIYIITITTLHYPCLRTTGLAFNGGGKAGRTAKAGKAPGVAKSPGAPPVKLHFDIEPASPTRTGPA